MSHAAPLHPVPPVTMTPVERPARSLHVKCLIGDKVMIDASLEAIITAISFSRTNVAPTYECEWWNGADLRSAWFAPERLKVL